MVQNCSFLLKDSNADTKFVFSILKFFKLTQFFKHTQNDFGVSTQKWDFTAKIGSFEY